MEALWTFLSDPDNQTTLTWLGGGLVVAAGGFWTVFKFFQTKQPKATASAPTILADNGGIASGRDTIIQTNHGLSSPALITITAMGFGAMILLAGLFGDRQQVEQGIGITGDVTDSTVNNIIGMPPEQFVEALRLAVSAIPGDQEKLLRKLDDLVPENSQFRIEAIARFFEILGEQPVANEDLAERFAQIADEHLKLLEETQRLKLDDPDVQALRDLAREALLIADHDTARAKLVEARELVRAKREALAELLAEQQREEALLVAEQGRIEHARLNYAEAASLLAEAESLLPENDQKTRRNYLIEASQSWKKLGTQFVDASALPNAIILIRQALQLAQRDPEPEPWARIQVYLGNALSDQGIRTGGEQGARLLAQAVDAYRGALQVYQRDELPQQWATTQNNLGAALRNQGIRTGGEQGTALLAQAVDAYNAALLVYQRDQLPQQWATTQNNLGAALRNQGTRTGGEQGAALLAQAVDAYQAALLVRTRDLLPQDWAMTQNNLGAALQEQGIRTGREQGAALLAQAVDAYNAALLVRTRNLLPQQWARTQNNLGGALAAIGEWQRDPQTLETARQLIQEVFDYFIKDNITIYDQYFIERIQNIEQKIAETKAR